MTRRLEIEPALGRLVEWLRRHDGDVARDTIDELRTFAVECCDIGMQLAHSRSTIPSPMRDESDGVSRYSIHFDDDTEVKP